MAFCPEVCCGIKLQCEKPTSLSISIGRSIWNLAFVQTEKLNTGVESEIAGELKDGEFWRVRVGHYNNKDMSQAMPLKDVRPIMPLKNVQECIYILVKQWLHICILA